MQKHVLYVLEFDPCDAPGACSPYDACVPNTNGPDYKTCDLWVPLVV